MALIFSERFLSLQSLLHSIYEINNKEKERFPVIFQSPNNKHLCTKKKIKNTRLIDADGQTSDYDSSCRFLREFISNRALGSFDQIRVRKNIIGKWKRIAVNARSLIERYMFRRVNGWKNNLSFRLPVSLLMFNAIHIYIFGPIHINFDRFPRSIYTFLNILLCNRTILHILYFVTFW